MNAAEQSDTKVLVELTGCSKEDAHTVLIALRTSFESDRDSDDVPVEQPGSRPMVWSATFEVSDVREQARPTPLTGSVPATVQGGYKAVDRLREQLDAAFSVHEEGAVSGDQEKELQLRLESGQ
ncbi:hypothetical protein ABCR94_33640 [Streptomyces sp. 21So2-11]